MLIKILTIAVVIIATMLIGGLIYLISKGRIFIWLYHDVMGWHLPNDEPQKFDGCSFHSHCKICGEEIMQDGQGNWF